jgi:hypothetical protein
MSRRQSLPSRHRRKYNQSPHSQKLPFPNRKLVRSRSNLLQNRRRLRQLHHCHRPRLHGRASKSASEPCWWCGSADWLGGIFTVRYSIQQGWIGPGVRVALGALLGAALVGAGEWLRRNESRSGIAGIPVANIPSILTAAGTTVAYATTYAAYALYGFVGPAAAFVLLGVVALATLAACRT